MTLNALVISKYAGVKFILITQVVQQGQTIVKPHQPVDD
jgi:hypothetical protein